MRELRLPLGPILAVNLSRDWKRVTAFEQTGPDDYFGPENGLVVVDVRGAVGAVVAVYGFAYLRGLVLGGVCEGDEGNGKRAGCGEDRRGWMSYGGWRRDWMGNAPESP